MSNRDKSAQLEELHKIIEPLYHAARGDYNSWSLSRDKKTTYNYSEAKEAMKLYVKTYQLTFNPFIDIDCD